MRKRKSIAIALIAAMTIGIVGCSESEIPATENQVNEITEFKDTPVRVGKSYMKVSLDVTPSGLGALEKLIEQSDVIADVTITGWLGESVHWETFFSADINHALKGENEQKTIRISQMGTGENTVYENPLFKKGDRMFLFLSKVTPEELKSREDNVEDYYWIVGLYSIILDIVELDGEKYALDRGMGEYLNLASLSREETRKLSDYFDESDPVIAELKRTQRTNSGQLVEEEDGEQIFYEGNARFHKEAYKYDRVIEKLTIAIERAEKGIELTPEEAYDELVEEVSRALEEAKKLEEGKVE
ncbi:MAG: hypothetical protein FWG83_08005 [Oscillospiraceae bacterium]|nr:hypothetical protein [Oscillospiraceae bacterium]